ncbi:MAG: hypothetical protein OTI37_05715 [Planctomycetota bacterium]|nr:hypothetical protein [Planctomycetota bacterium]
MSTDKKFAWGCLAVVLLLFGSAYMGWRWVATNLHPTQDPAIIAERQQFTIDIDIPSDFTPSFSMYTAEYRQDVVLAYSQEDKRTVLSQLILHQQSTPFSKEEAENRMGNSFPGLQITRLEFHETEPVRFTVPVSFQEQPVPVTYEEGRAKEEADLSHVYSAFFEYRGQHMSIMLAGDPKFLNRGQFEQLLKSIK